MWIYAHVDGEVDASYPGVVSAVQELERCWARDTRRHPLRRALKELARSMKETSGKLRPYDEAPEASRAVAHAAYTATLDLAVLLDDAVATEDTPWPGPVEMASSAVRDLLEEWRPYISHDDAAQHLIRLDGIAPAEARALVERIEAAPASDLDDDCPLCRELARMEELGLVERVALPCN